MVHLVSFVNFFSSFVINFQVKAFDIGCIDKIVFNKSLYVFILVS